MLESEPNGYAPNEINIEGYTPEQIGYHAYLLNLGRPRICRFCAR
ncbi:MAG: hypothetical protein NTW65_13400 [Deltaproteobacteria bacterium]|nr:hypothetical protein [Deltaproteobacteria bacterium]